ncbi:MAG: adenosine deaminase [Chloroflexota bacterium]|nr:adenosine deaminase [Chloroflexota bacterium]
MDLHRHLEGSLRLGTLADIARQHGIDLPGFSIEDLRPLVTATGEEPDFHRFLEKFKLLRRFYPTQEAVERVAYEAVADAADDNVKYLELRFNPVALALHQGFPLDGVTDWVCRAVAEAERAYDVRTNLIIQIGRDATVRTARELARVALAHADQGVVGLDLAGDERRYPAAPFIDIFRQARRDGLHVTVHAGEAGPAKNVEEAIADLEGERIGHGIRCVEDPNVVSLIRERNVTLEVCPTSNVQTGVVRDLSRHPLPELLALDLPVSVNTDDPSVSDTTLTNEYWIAVSTMNITLDQIKHMIVTAAEASFQPPDDRRRLAAWFRRKLALDDETDTTGDPQ